jgi:6-phosphogluconate dehydrogenase
LGEVARIWRGGCIIRARWLDEIRAAYTQDPSLANLLLSAHFSQALDQRQEPWRQVVRQAAGMGVPVPALSASLAYFDSLRSANLPANLIQAQRDYFGAHTYRRTDREGQFHTFWTEESD